MVGCCTHPVFNSRDQLIGGERELETKAPHPEVQAVTHGDGEFEPRGAFADSRVRV
jgi:hypothetical protein